MRFHAIFFFNAQLCRNRQHLIHEQLSRATKQTLIALVTRISFLTLFERRLRILYTYMYSRVGQHTFKIEHSKTNSTGQDNFGRMIRITNGHHVCAPV